MFGSGLGASGVKAATATAGVVSTVNSTTTLLAAGASFTGEWELAGQYSSVTLAAKTDQNGTFTVQFSPDGVNQDSTLTRYYRTDQIEAPHRFTVTRQYFRVVFTNTSASDQTYLRLQSILGLKESLNAPLDSTLAQDFDSLPTRPTDYKQEVALGLRQGHSLWNKFGRNLDVDTGGAEVLASWGGTYVPPTTARTLSVVSSSTDDADGGTGSNNVVIYGIDADRKSQVVVVTLNGTTPVVTTETWLGINRMSIGLSGSGQRNAGDITATTTTDLAIQAQIPVGAGTSQQCIFHTQVDHQALAEWITINVIREGGGSEPVVTLIAWVFSHVSNSYYEVARQSLDVNLENNLELKPPLPFPIGESSTFMIEVETDRNNTQVSGRFSLIEVRDIDA